MWWQLLPTAVGAWLMIAPYALGYIGSGAEMNDRIVGPFICCFAIVAMGEATRNVRYWNVPLGAWMVIAPLLFSYPAMGAVSAVVSGLLTIALPFKPRKIEERFAGGWTVLFKRDPYDVANGSADEPANPNAEPGPSHE